MEMNYLDKIDNLLFIYCIYPFLNIIDMYNLSVVSKNYSQMYKGFEAKSSDIFTFFTKQLSFNIRHEKFLLYNCIHDNKFMFCIYDENNLEDGVYFLSKTMYINEEDLVDIRADYLIFTPIIKLSEHQHNIFIILIKHGDERRTFMVNKYKSFTTEYIFEYSIMKQFEMLIKIY